ncbi:conserved hypothetical protein [Luminiphilus syltensis NOR5-1B]|uniref:Uncharacterized protein n=1 Tax=Luminiphilus syltensis NOR5-1B TaxID=565045 RepID=B8KY54_9GAMM|nr:RidA family protein [Luminiphilus syltensis]EED35620.1 conserved hypothetical protein [Luminiphilus syltensis NOR5-1B]
MALPDEDIQHIESADLVSTGVIYDGVLYFSGLTDESTDNHNHDAYEQTRIILDNVDRYLKLYGSNRRRLLQVQIWLADMSDFNTMNRAWVEWLGNSPRPARACVQAGLAGPQYRVEVMVTAAIEQDHCTP